MFPITMLKQDFEEGKGALPEDGQQVTFDYTAYNESGSRIDSTYTKGRPAQTRLGIDGLIPGEAFCIAPLCLAPRAFKYNVKASRFYNLQCELDRQHLLCRLQ